MPTRPKDRPQLPIRTQHLLVTLALLSLTILVYQDLFTHSFVAYDDISIIVNHAPRYAGISQKTLRGIILDDFPREEPLILRDLSYLINAHIFGALNPGGYLLGNLLLHLIASYLVFSLAHRLFPGRTALATTAAILFAIHPLNCEAVAWISARKDTLYAVCYLLAVHAYLSSLDSARPPALILTWSFAVFIAALFAKSAAISFVPFVLSYRLIMRKATRLSRPEMIFFIGSTIATACYSVWYSGQLKAYGVFSATTASGRDWGAWLLVSVESLFFYIAKLVCPNHLSIVYSFPAPGQLTNHPLFLALTLAFFLLLFSAILLWSRRQGDRRLFLLVAWFFCALLPYLDLASVGIYVANRYAYLASIPFLIGMVWLGTTLLQGLRLPGNTVGIPSLLCAFLAIFCLSSLTKQQVTTWRDSRSLWENALQQDPNSMAAHVALMGDDIGRYLGDPAAPSSQALLDHASQIGGSAMQRFSYGNGRYERALHLVTSQLGQIAWYRGEPAQAEHFFRLTFKLNPNYLKGRYLYATILAAQHRDTEAAHQLAAILSAPQRPLDQDIAQAAAVLQASLTPTR